MDGKGHGKGKGKTKGKQGPEGPGRVYWSGAVVGPKGKGKSGHSDDWWQAKLAYDSMVRGDAGKAIGPNNSACWKCTGPGGCSYAFNPQSMVVCTSCGLPWSYADRAGFWMRLQQAQVGGWDQGRGGVGGHAGKGSGGKGPGAGGRQAGQMLGGWTTLKSTSKAPLVGGPGVTANKAGDSGKEWAKGNPFAQLASAGAEGMADESLDVDMEEGCTPKVAKGKGGASDGPADAASGTRGNDRTDEREKAKAEIAELDNSIQMLKQTIQVTRTCYKVSNEAASGHVVCGPLVAQLEQLEEKRKVLWKTVADGRPPAERMAAGHKVLGQLHDKIKKSETRVQNVQNRLANVQKELDEANGALQRQRTKLENTQKQMEDCAAELALRSDGSKSAVRSEEGDGQRLAEAVRGKTVDADSLLSMLHELLQRQIDAGDDGAHNQGLFQAVKGYQAEAVRLQQEQEEKQKAAQAALARQEDEASKAAAAAAAVQVLEQDSGDGGADGDNKDGKGKGKDKSQASRNGPY